MVASRISSDHCCPTLDCSTTERHSSLVPIYHLNDEVISLQTCRERTDEAGFWGREPSWAQASDFARLLRTLWSSSGMPCCGSTSLERCGGREARINPRSCGRDARIIHNSEISRMHRGARNQSYAMQLLARSLHCACTRPTPKVAPTFGALIICEWVQAHTRCIYTHTPPSRKPSSSIRFRSTPEHARQACGPAPDERKISAETMGTTKTPDLRAARGIATSAIGV